MGDSLSEQLQGFAYGRQFISTITKVGICIWETVYQHNCKGWDLHRGDSLSAQLQGLGFAYGRQFISTITRVGVRIWQTVYQHNYNYAT